MVSTRRAGASQPGTTGTDGPRVLKKYPNRRLYDTKISSYITLADASISRCVTRRPAKT